MELRPVERKDKTLILEAKGESTSFVNLIRSELWEYKSVREAAYVKEHPYLEEPKIFVKTSRGKPETFLKRVSKRIVKKAKKMRSKFEKELES